MDRQGLFPFAEREPVLRGMLHTDNSTDGIFMGKFFIKTLPVFLIGARGLLVEWIFYVDRIVAISFIVSALESLLKSCKNL